MRACSSSRTGREPDIAPPSEEQPLDPTAAALLDFWFGASPSDLDALEAHVDRWFSSIPELDAALRERFGDLPARALAGELEPWREDPRGAVALILALDQLPRNLQRGSAAAFACDARALEVARQWMADGGDLAVEPVLAVFGYLPLEHAEDLDAQRESVARYEGLARRVGAEWRPRFEGFCDYARAHLEIIERFGRFPHRNRVLGRQPTAEETAWLEAGGETFGG